MIVATMECPPDAARIPPFGRLGLAQKAALGRREPGPGCDEQRDGRARRVAHALRERGRVHRRRMPAQGQSPLRVADLPVEGNGRRTHLLLEGHHDSSPAAAASPSGPRLRTVAGKRRWRLLRRMAIANPRAPARLSSTATQQRRARTDTPVDQPQHERACRAQPGAGCQHAGDDAVRQDRREALSGPAGLQRGKLQVVVRQPAQVAPQGHAHRRSTPHRERARRPALPPRREAGPSCAPHPWPRAS